MERRGLRTFSASRARRGLELAQRHHPDLIVLDLEVEDSTAEGLSVRFAEHSRSECAPLVLLGTARRGRSPASGDADGNFGEFVAKPYHYGSLIRRIEELLVVRRR